MALDRQLTRDQELEISRIWMQSWHNRSVPSMQVAWYQVILDFIYYQGGQVFSEELRLLEGLVIERGLSTEYIQTLKSLVSPPSDIEVDDQFVLLMSAPSDLREQALRFVLGER